MSTEEVVEVYIPDDPDIQEFHSLSNEQKLKIIKLGLAMSASGNRKLQYLNNSEWEKRIESLKERHAAEKERLEDRASATDQRLLEYTRESKSRQDVLVEEIRVTEKRRYKSQIEQLESDKERLGDKIATIHDDLDTKLEARIASSRTFYEGKLASIQDKLDRRT